MLSKYRKVIENPHSKELLTGTIITLSIKIIGMILGYAFVIYISRLYGAKAIGIYQVSIQFIILMAIVSLFGFNQLIVKLASSWENNNGSFNTLIKEVSIIVLASSFVLSILIYFFSEDIALQLLKDQKQAIIFQSLALILPFAALQMLHVEVIRGMKKIKTSETLRVFLINLTNILILLGILAYTHFNDFIPVVVYEISMLISFTLTICFSIKYMKEKYPVPYSGVIERKKYLSASFTMYQSILLMLLSNQALVLMLAYYTSPEQVGIYNVAFQVSSLCSFVFAAVTTIAAPKYSELYASDLIEFKKMVKLSSKVFFWSTGSLSFLMMVFSGWLMGLFGEEFIAGSSILILLAIGHFVNAFTGASGVLLDMVGKQHIRRNIMLLNTMVTVSLSFLLIPEFGAIGLACVFLINNLVGNFVAVLYVYRGLGVNMIYFPLLVK